MAKNLDRVIDTEAFLRSIRPDEPPVPRKKVEADEQAVEPQKEKTTEVENKKQVPLTKEEMQAKDKEYLKLFINETPTPARSGKVTYVRNEYHKRIAQIVHIISNDKMTFSSYLDYVLTHHFEEYEDSIRRLYKKNFQDII